VEEGASEKPQPLVHENNTSDPQSRKLYVSRLLLALHSPHFAKLLTQGNPPPQLVINVGSFMEINYFIDVIRCIYNVEMESKVNELFEVFVMAIKYEVGCAMQKCSMIIRQQLSLGSVCAALELPAEICENEYVRDVVNTSKEYLITNFGDLQQAVYKADFSELSQKALTMILDSEQLTFDSENTVFHVILLWISHKPERTQYLEAFLPFVKFPHMRRFYLLSVPFMIKDFPIETVKKVMALHNEALEFKVGGYEWVKEHPPIALSTPGRFVPRTKHLNAPSNFMMNEKWPEVHTWQLDKPYWSRTFFSNGYSLQFYICKTPQSFGVYLHVTNSFISSVDFCLPLSFSIFLLSKSQVYDKIKSCRTTFRKNSKGVPNLGINHEDYVMNDTISVQLEVTFEKENEFIH